MGFALADAARERGARVTLITTVPPPLPDAYDLVQYVETVADMREAVLTACQSAAVLLMAAAVSDFRVARPAAHKLKKQGQTVILELVENADFLLELPDTFGKVGVCRRDPGLARERTAKTRAEALGLYLCE
jgi:phosphopantothenoylcysteine decarboxylase/phosphopantothenate--cysteine ligase